ncbi:MAG: 16S rRNA (guanine(527)-N(7))-methyltransferase RsmG [Paracoccus sp. (in: a-proteobacteria)]|uniref:16S rRNA (guanine(527)-N(7))-methyltransferase RsmG n=1 Tax=Paracoccus sp. TaxID=267 RepID=UPI003918B2C9
MSVSRETIQKLERYAALVERWNQKINLVSAKTLPDFRERHIADCLQLANAVGDLRGRWVDMGTGAGLPGIVLAISLAQRGIQFTLLESDRRKCAFLRTVIRELELHNTLIVTERIELSVPQKADVVSARALAPLPLLLSYVDRHMKPDGEAWLMKGRSWRQEIDEAALIWRFQTEIFPSSTDPEAAILKISGVSHA